MTMDILIVEDEALNAQMMELVLKKRGDTVVATVDSGEETLRLLLEERQPVDLILMDIRLNGALDGIETVKKLHEERFIPVVYITASTDRETFERAHRTKMQGYLKKPYLVEDLQRLVGEMEKQYNF